VRFVNKDSTTESADRRYHYIHGMPVGPNRDAIAGMVLQDVKEKAMSLERIMQAPACPRCHGCTQEDSFCGSELHHTMRYTPDEVRPAAAIFDNKVAELVCDIQRLQKSASLLQK
jgi:hypothetical protein